MQIIDPSSEIIKAEIDPALIEAAGRTCYQSHDKITPDSADAFCRRIIRRGHESVLEHSLLTVRFVCSRAISHELVRHRLCAFSQESQRYVNYEGKGCTFIRPLWVDEGLAGLGESTLSAELMACKFDEVSQKWACAASDAEHYYLDLLSMGLRPEQAREVLPNSTKTELVMSANVRQWRHVFHLRTSKAAHPEMRRLMVPLLEKCAALAPCLFGDINTQEEAE